MASIGTSPKSAPSQQDKKHPTDFQVVVIRLAYFDRPFVWIDLEANRFLSPRRDLLHHDPFFQRLRNHSVLSGRIVDLLCRRTYHLFFRHDFLQRASVASRQRIQSCDDQRLAVHSQKIAVEV